MMGFGASLEFAFFSREAIFYLATSLIVSRAFLLFTTTTVFLFLSYSLSSLRALGCFLRVIEEHSLNKSQAYCYSCIAQFNTFAYFCRFNSFSTYTSFTSAFLAQAYFFPAPPTAFNTSFSGCFQGCIFVFSSGIGFCWVKTTDSQPIRSLSSLISSFFQFLVSALFFCLMSSFIWQSLLRVPTSRSKLSSNLELRRSSFIDNSICHSFQNYQFSFFRALLVLVPASFSYEHPEIKPPPICVFTSKSNAYNCPSGSAWAISTSYCCFSGVRFFHLAVGLISDDSSFFLRLTSSYLSQMLLRRYLTYASFFSCLCRTSASSSSFRFSSSCSSTRLSFSFRRLAASIIICLRRSQFSMNSAESAWPAGLFHFDI